MCGRAGIILSATFAAILSLNVSTSLAGSTSPTSTAIKSRFDLPAESLDKALRDFAVQANCNISYEPSMVAGLHAPAIKGEFTLSDVLSLMLMGTKLRAVNVNEDTIQILEMPAAASQDASATRKSSYQYSAGADRLAYADSDVPPPVPVSPDSRTATSAAGNVQVRDQSDLEEIVVTGS